MMRLTARGDDVFAVSKPRPLQIIITGKAPNLSADVLAFYVQQKRDYIPPHTRRVEARLESRWKEVAVLRGSTAATDLDALQSLLEVSKAAVAGTAERSAQEEADWVEQGMDEDYSSCRISWGLWASPMS